MMLQTSRSSTRALASRGVVNAVLADTRKTIKIKASNKVKASRTASADRDTDVPAVEAADKTTRIFAFVDHLFFHAKLQEVSRKLNVKVEFVKTEKEIAEKTSANTNPDEKPSLIVVDLNSNSIKPLTVIAKLRSKYKKPTSIVGFVSHVQGDLKVKAQEAGCDVVMPRSAFSQNLPNILRRHGAEDEPDENFNRV